MHTVNSLNPTIPLPQSLFKLPALFILIIYVLSVFVSVLYFYTLYESYHDVHNKGVFLEILMYFPATFLSLVPYFFIAVLLFIDSKIHQLTKSTCLIIVMMGIIYILLKELSVYLLNLTIENFYYSQENYIVLQSILDYYTFIRDVILLLLFIGVIKLIGLINKKERLPYSLDSGNHQTFFAVLYTLIFLAPGVLLFFLISKLLVALFVTFSHSSEVAYFINNCLFLFLASIVGFFIVCTVKNGFQRQFTFIPLNLIIKSAVLAHLYLFIMSLVIISISFAALYILEDIYRGSEYFYMFFFMAFALFICLIVIFIAAVLSSQIAIKKYFFVDK